MYALLDIREGEELLVSYRRTSLSTGALAGAKHSRHSAGIPAATPSPSSSFSAFLRFDWDVRGCSHSHLLSFSARNFCHAAP